MKLFCEPPLHFVVLGGLEELLAREERAMRLDEDDMIVRDGSRRTERAHTSPIWHPPAAK